MTIDREIYDTHRTYLAYLMGEFTVPYLVQCVKTFDGDPILGVVLGEIAQHNVRRYYESREFDPASTRKPAIEDPATREALMGRCNALSISRSTGIPRETVRRRVDELLKRGWVTRDARGNLRAAAGLSERFDQFNVEQLERFVEVAARVQQVLAAGRRKGPPSR